MEKSFIPGHHGNGKKDRRKPISFDAAYTDSRKLTLALRVFTCSQRLAFFCFRKKNVKTLSPIYLSVDLLAKARIFLLSQKKRKNSVSYLSFCGFAREGSHFLLSQKNVKTLFKSFWAKATFSSMDLVRSLWGLCSFRYLKKALASSSSILSYSDALKKTFNSIHNLGWHLSSRTSTVGRQVIRDPRLA